MRALLAPLVVVLAVATPADAGSGVTVTIAGSAGTGATDAYRATVVTKIKRSYLAGIKSCYRAALKEREGLEGMMTVSFIVDTRGAATELETTFDESIVPCVLKAAKTWKFGVPKDRAKAAVPATFTIELKLAAPLNAERMAAQISVLTAADDEATGSMSNRRPGADLDAQIRRAKDPSSNHPGTGARGTADGDPTKTNGSPSVVKGPPGRVTFSDAKALDESTLTADMVLRKVGAAYMGGLKRCYKTRLAVDATLRGKIKLDFSVNEAGRATRATARGFDPEIDACISGMMANWIFAVPKDRDGELTEASFNMTLTLVPD